MGVQQFDAAVAVQICEPRSLVLQDPLRGVVVTEGFLEGLAPEFSALLVGDDQALELVVEARRRASAAGQQVAHAGDHDDRGGSRGPEVQEPLGRPPVKCVRVGLEPTVKLGGGGPNVSLFSRKPPDRKASFGLPILCGPGTDTQVSGDLLPGQQPLPLGSPSKHGVLLDSKPSKDRRLDSRDAQKFASA